MTLTFGSLFAGIGGIDLGFERAGLIPLWQIENNDFCNKVLAKHWPSIPRYGDIEGVNGADLPTPDIICGGFPCQPVSHAGKRKGRGDPRWLWPQMARLVDEVRPAYVVVENVPGLLSMGGAEVLSDLATMGFDAEWGFVSARDAGAPHIRERVWIVAYPKGAGAGVEGRQSSDQRRKGTDSRGTGLHGRPVNASDVGVATGGRGEGDGGEEGVADPDNNRLVRFASEDRPHRRLDRSSGNDASGRGVGDGGDHVADPQVLDLGTGLRPSGEGRIRDGRSGNSRRSLSWDHDPADDPQSGMGRVAARLPGRVDRLKALGNAVVPQVAEMVARRVLEIHRDHLPD